MFFNVQFCREVLGRLARLAELDEQHRAEHSTISPSWRRDDASIVMKTEEDEEEEIEIGYAPSRMHST